MLLENIHAIRRTAIEIAEAAKAVTEAAKAVNRVLCTLERMSAPNTCGIAPDDDYIPGEVTKKASPIGLSSDAPEHCPVTRKSGITVDD